jgi:hypothetical protein
VFLKVFNHQKWEWYIYFKCQIVIFGIQCVAKYVEGWQRTYNSCLVYSLTWLNLRHDDHQFFVNLSLDGGQPFKTKVLTKPLNWCNVPMAAGWLKVLSEKWMHNNTVAIGKRTVTNMAVWNAGFFPQIQLGPLARILSITGKGSSVLKGVCSRWSVACLQMFCSTWRNRKCLAKVWD